MTGFDQIARCCCDHGRKVLTRWIGLRLKFSRAKGGASQHSSLGRHKGSSLSILTAAVAPDAIAWLMPVPVSLVSSRGRHCAIVAALLMVTSAPPASTWRSVDVDNLTQARRSSNCIHSHAAPKACSSACSSRELPWACRDGAVHTCSHSHTARSPQLRLEIAMTMTASLSAQLWLLLMAIKWY